MEESFESNETRFELRMISLYPDSLIEGLLHKFGSAFGRLNQTEKLAIIIAESEGRVTNRRLQELSDLHGRDLTYLLKGLVDQVFLSPFEDRQSRYYTVNLGDNSQSLGDRPQSLGDNGKNLGDKSYLDQVKMSRRIDPEIMEKAILEVCEEPKTIEQIATAVGRKDKKELRERLISKLARRGELELKYPNAINHPQQAYKTKK